MEHTEAISLLVQYCEDELAPAQTKSLEEHLGTCLLCRQELERLRLVLGGLHGLGATPAPPDFVEGVVTRINKRSGGRWFSGKRAEPRVPYELVSVLMLVLLLILYLFLQIGAPGHLQLP